MELLFGEGKVTKREIVVLAKETHAATDDNYGEQEAIDWAQGFEFLEGLGERDAAQVAGSGSLSEAV